MDGHRLLILLKDCGWWVLRKLGLVLFYVIDLLWSIGFAFGVWLLTDLPASVEAWKWKRAHRTHLGRCSKCGTQGWCLCEMCQHEKLRKKID